MNQAFQGDITNNVVELNLQAVAVNVATPTVVYDTSSDGVINQIMGDVPPDWENSDSSLYGLVIGTSCTAIGSLAFYYCTGLTGSLVIPDSVTSIGDQAFDNCTGFTGTLTFGNGVTVIGSSAFYACAGFTGSLTIPDNVINIDGGGTFNDCTGFTGTLTIGNGVTNIGANAFNGCSSITRIEILATTAPTIAISAFLNMTAVSPAEIHVPVGATGYAATYNGLTVVYDL